MDKIHMAQKGALVTSPLPPPGSKNSKQLLKREDTEPPVSSASSACLTQDALLITYARVDHPGCSAHESSLMLEWITQQHAVLMSCHQCQEAFYGETVGAESFVGEW